MGLAAISNTAVLEDVIGYYLNLKTQTLDFGAHATRKLLKLQKVLKTVCRTCESLGHMFN